MSFLVVKDASGVVVAWGPNDGNYAPGVPAGGSLSEAEQKPDAVPQKVDVVSMKQAQLALLAAGHLDAVDALIQTQTRAVQIVWATSGTVERNNPLAASIGAAIGLNDAQIDALFEQASRL